MQEVSVLYAFTPLYVPLILFMYTLLCHIIYVSQIFRILKPGCVFVFVEPAKGTTTIDLIGELFPKEIVISPEALGRFRSGTGTGSDVRSDDRSGESSVSNNKRNKNKSNKKYSGKKNTGFASTSTTAVDTVITEATTTSTSTTALVDADDDTVAGDEIIKVSDKANNSDTTDKKSVSNIRPGLVYETYNNIIDSYVSGIAVKPY